MNEKSSSAPTNRSTGPAKRVTVCPLGHTHILGIDKAGFDVYGFLTVLGMPCPYNNFRLRTEGA